MRKTLILVCILFFTACSQNYNLNKSSNKKINNNFNSAFLLSMNKEIIYVILKDQLKGIKENNIYSIGKMYISSTGNELVIEDKILTKSTVESCVFRDNQLIEYYSQGIELLINDERLFFCANLLEKITKIKD